ncbi:hypothetical protein [Zeimonas arvi]|nr:hypothetical protein [Zeimonas arvi]
MQTDPRTDRYRDEITHPTDPLEQFLALSAVHLGLDTAGAEGPGAQDD